ncbi:MAG TPA: dihydrodipicolinate synthase family protein [Ktedonosporobacter sp.]|nr:dihydrodipicolinate synthase family protein [Ktedonosporobacter sp.]
MPTLLPRGVYPPLPTFFTPHDELDLPTLQQHVRLLASSGIAGYVLMGSNGEAVHLSSDERVQVITAARHTLQQNGHHLPLIAGCGDQSTRSTIVHCQRAARSGANFALILPPFYYRSLMDSAALIAHYRAVADHSPLPILIYNMPANTANLDLDAPTISALAEHPNIIGVKDSAGNIAKLAQIVASVPPTFQVFAGSAGFFLPALSVGAVGVVAALANVFPHAVCRIQHLFDQDQREEAQLLQERIIQPNAAVTSIYGVPGLKAALTLTAGYGGDPRLPLQPLSDQDRAALSQIFAQAHLEA